MMNRREFIVAAGAMAGVGQLVTPGATLPAADRIDEWFDRPMRWMQLVLVENDPRRYDVDFWLDYFRRVHADAACLSAGGCVAYYPTRIKHHHQCLD